MNLKKELTQALKTWLPPSYKLIPETFYMHLFKLNGWRYNPEEVSEKAEAIAKWVSVLILDRLKGSGEGKTKTVDLELNAQVEQIITLLKISDNMRDVWGHFTKLYKANTPQAPYDFDDQGHTVIPVELSDFNKKLKQALEYNPKRK